MDSSESTKGFGFGTIVLVGFVTFIIYYFVKKSFKPVKVKKPKLSEQEIDQILSNWSPEPLVPETQPDHHALNVKLIDGKVTKNVEIEGKKYLNFSTSNFLSMVGEPRIEEVAKKTIYKYGVGSCGPRGFYGTVDVHLDLESDLAKFMGTEEAVLYSYGFATIASAISAYAKAGDIIYVDRNANFAIQKGIQASRSKIEWFDHNDMEDLERLLIKQAEWDAKNPKQASKIRRFLVVEGLYANSADLCPLPKIIELKWKYKVRVFIDESWSFGVVGKTGRGVTEHFGVPIEDVDMIMSSLENSIASTGGFCVGRSYIVAHQRLSGQGYCFSASLPPLLATAASEALHIIKEQPERIAKTQQLSCLAHTLLQKVLDGTGFVLRGVEQSPMKHIGYDGEKQIAETKLDALVDHMFDDHSILLTRARYLDSEEAFPVSPSIRFMLQYAVTEEELQKTIEAIGAVVKEKL